MAAKSTGYGSALLALIFNGTTYTGLAENTTTSPLTSLYVSLHTASPGVSGNQTTSETTYTSYARQAVARSTSGWTVSGETVNPAAIITFPQCTASSSDVITYFAVGTAASGSGSILYFGAISPTVTMANGVQPELTTSSSVTEA